MDGGLTRYMAPSPNRKVKSTDTTFDILEILCESNELTIKQIANALDIAKSTAHTHLKTLEAQEFIVKEGQHYRIGLKPLEYGIKGKEAYSELLEVSKEPMRQLADETGEVVWLFVEEHGDVVYMSFQLGDRAVPTRGKVGMRASIYRLAAGKAILAHMSEARRENLISQAKFSDDLSVPFNSESEIRSELEEIKAQGIAFNRGRTVSKSRALSTPIMSDESIIAAISIAGPESRFNGEYYNETLTKLIKDAANEIELKLEYPSRSR